MTSLVGGWKRGVEDLCRGRGLNGGVMADREKFTRTRLNKHSEWLPCCLWNF